MSYIRDTFVRFKSSDLFLKILLLGSWGAVIYIEAFPKTRRVNASISEEILFYAFIFTIFFMLWSLLLLMESKAAEIEWKGCETPESRTLVTKFIVRGALIAAIVIGFFG